MSNYYPIPSRPSWSPNSTDLYFWYLFVVDDQHRNTNMNDKDHLVGQLTIHVRVSQKITKKEEEKRITMWFFWDFSNALSHHCTVAWVTLPEREGRYSSRFQGTRVINNKYILVSDSHGLNSWVICKIDPAALLYLNNGLFMRVRSTGDFKGWSLNARGVWPLTISEYLHRGLQTAGPAFL